MNDEDQLLRDARSLAKPSRELADLLWKIADCRKHRDTKGEYEALSKLMTNIQRYATDADEASGLLEQFGELAPHETCKVVAIR